MLSSRSCGTHMSPIDYIASSAQRIEPGSFLPRCSHGSGRSWRELLAQTELCPSQSAALTIMPCHALSSSHCASREGDTAHQSGIVEMVQPKFRQWIVRVAGGVFCDECQCVVDREDENIHSKSTRASSKARICGGVANVFGEKRVLRREKVSQSIALRGWGLRGRDSRHSAVLRAGLTTIAPLRGARWPKPFHPTCGRAANERVRASVRKLYSRPA